MGKKKADNEGHAREREELARANEALRAEIGEHKRLAEALRESEERFRNMIDASSDWVWEVDGNAVYTYSSPKVRDILGYAPEEVLGKTPFDLMDPVEARRVAAIFNSIAAAKRPFSMLENTNRHRNGNPVVLETSGVPILGKKGELMGYRGIDRDVTGRKRLEEDLKRMATTDSLTGAYNRVRFDEIINGEMRRARRYGRPLSVSIFDIDDFKKINDKYGHSSGDEVLRKVAETARKNVRETSHLFRWGGEEFIIVLPETDIGGARVQAERIRKAIERLEFSEAASVTVSFGITAYANGDTIDAFVKRADDALYRAKTGGKNRVEKGA